MMCMTPEDLFGSLQSIPRLEGARCVGEWEIFDNEHGSAELEEYALNLCGSCPALTACRDWIDSLPGSRKPYGVVAGRVVHDYKKAAA